MLRSSRIYVEGSYIKREPAGEPGEVEGFVGVGTADEGGELEDLLVDVGFEIGEVSTGILSHVSLLSSW